MSLAVKGRDGRRGEGDRGMKRIILRGEMRDLVILYIVKLIDYPNHKLVLFVALVPVLFEAGRISSSISITLQIICLQSWLSNSFSPSPTTREMRRSRGAQFVKELILASFFFFFFFFFLWELKGGRGRLSQSRK